MQSTDRHVSIGEGTQHNFGNLCICMILGPDDVYYFKTVLQTVIALITGFVRPTCRLSSQPRLRGDLPSMWSGGLLSFSLAGLQGERMHGSGTLIIEIESPNAQAAPRDTTRHWRTD
jgi:hypothetical protein